ncbi:TetR/AcrR family transcriptional regulator [Oscillibacter sp.]|jgi:AcrR family transcriptional regulator|uniref:TetR/AcrR family transcriptional regulator n=1 Tax=Oscillibacter sp. TaxID=1945593 RepID=UPI00216F0E4C|nr:TetR/AcrR family transcriptional regulator [Oscillibacter sp.]MCI9649282.1 TetR/AcrR family transcriptional regulator [Oscillibacter sp.]
MPSNTFLNLPEDKQTRLMDAASREFSAKPYNEASINKIIQEAGIPRGSFYMYFQDKEELFRYLVHGYVEQLLMVLEEALLREGGDVFAAMRALFDYVWEKREERALGGMGAMSAIISRNGGMQRGALLDLLDSGEALERLRQSVNPALLDLRREEDLDDLLAVLLSVAGPLLYAGIEAGDAPGYREHLDGILDILRRGMAKDKAPKISESEEKSV